MKVYIIFALLFVGIYGEKKINLEDIERDNLRAEKKPKSEDIRAEETKYTQPEAQHQYQGSSQFNAPINSPTSYVSSQQTSNVPPETYISSNKYAVREHVYQQPNVVLPDNNIQVQYYNGYQQQPSLSTKGIAPSIYESQQFVYQPEVSVGNQFQNVQQKAATEKYAKNINKETVYVSIPMTQLLTYYPNLNIDSGRSNVLSGQPFLHQLATTAAHQISIPVYTPGLNQKSIIPVKPSYQLQYTSKPSTAIPGTFATKITKGFVYTSPITSKKFATSSLVTAPLYYQPDQSYAQGKNLYTQAYVAPPQPQYIPQFVYTQSPALYTHAAPVYTDAYSRVPSYVQDNSIQGTPSQYDTKTQQVYVQSTIADETPKHTLRQEASQSVSKNYVKVVEEPINHFIPPQLPAQDFEPGVTHLSAVPPSQDDESTSVQNHVSLSEPRSLLDTYVPSKVIAAQDVERYRERPIKLEGGFLPSKESFLHKKRKSE